MKRPDPLSPVEAHQELERLLVRPATLVLTHHVRDRMRQRRFTTDDILRVLRHGTVATKAEWDEARRVWTYTVSYRDCDGEPLSIVVSIVEESVIVITGHE